jgi:hypothetical protein
MTRNIASHAAKLTLAALTTFAMFAGTQALAAHQYRVAAASQPSQVAVQHVTIVGHRSI